MKFPDIDIIMPTYNWATRLESCLEPISKQDYNGKLNITIVDGHSSDETLSIARKYNCNILQIDHKYPEGKNGLKNYGVSLTNSDYVCIVDGDNIIQTKDYFKLLITPFLEDNSICLSVPKPVTDEKSPSFTNFITLKELIPYESMMKKAVKKPYGYIVEDMWYGIYNSTLIKRECLKKVYGWDKDIMVLKLLRYNRLSKGALVPNAI
ncbi:MAG: glycosyltransferase [Thermoplasmata archaeon]